MGLGSGDTKSLFYPVPNTLVLQGDCKEREGKDSFLMFGPHRT